MKQNVLVIGNGGREHAIVKSLSSSSSVEKIFILPGNGGTQESKAVNVSFDVKDYEELLVFIKENNISLTIIGPEAPLADGIVDFLEANGCLAFGPCKAAAALEYSKIFMKEVLVAAEVPTAKYKVFDESNYKAVAAYIQEFKGASVVIKADGLASGKGVFIASSLEEAKTVTESLILGKIGEAGKKFIIEEFLDGMEVSLFAITDGQNIINFSSACDYKRIFENDLGPNTGGMGTFSPSFLTLEQEEFFVETLVKPVVQELARRGIVYKGVLFAGLMVKDGEAKILEFNCRLGDPETQSILTRFEGDFYEIAYRVSIGELAEYTPAFRPKCAVSIVLAGKDYPSNSSKGEKISLPENILEDEFIFHSGTALKEESLVTNGGRILTVTALSDTKANAREKAYLLADKITFNGMQKRDDIAEELVLLFINTDEEGWKEVGIGFYDFFNRLAKVSLKKHFLLKPSFLNDSSKLYEFSVLLTNDESITLLNKEHRGKNKPTNVLSFRLAEEYERGKILMGDVVISLETIKKEALEQSKSFKEHLAHLFVHSILHLIGYDHAEMQEMEFMEALEDDILLSVDI